MTFTPSAQQTDLFNWVSTGEGSALVVAVAGAGKTTSIVKALDLMEGYVFLGAYNSKMAKELKERVSGRKNVFASTFHSAGYKQLRFTYGARHALRVDGLKVAEIANDIVKGGREDLVELVGAVVNIVSMAKQRGFGALGTPLNQITEAAWLDMIAHFGLEDALPEDARMDQVVAFARVVLQRSNLNLEIIDYDDMVYLPLQRNLRMLQNDWVLIDEAQDTNPTRRALAAKMLKPGGRLIAVGDPCQPVGTRVQVAVKNSRWAAEEPKTVAIEDLKVGDMVVSYRAKDCAWLPQGRRVNGVTHRPFDGHLVVVTTSTGLVSRYTPNHYCLGNFTALRDKYAVYISRKNGQYRVGKAKMDYKAASGVACRMNAEQADAAWILSVHDTEDEAYFQEQAVSGRFGIPQLMFSPKKLLRGPSGDNSVRGEEALGFFGRDAKYPLFNRGTGKQQTIKRPFVFHASNFMDGVKVLPYERKINDVHARTTDWDAVTVTRERYVGTVVSLDVDDTHLYVADGVLTRNCQAIFGFTGADNDSLSIIKDQFNCVEMPLTVTYRCPKAVVKHARNWVNHITAHESAPEGIVRSMPYNEDFFADVQAGDAVICRQNKFLVRAFFQFVRDGKAAKIEGRAIGQGLSALASKWKIMSLDALTNKLDAYLIKEVEKALKAKQEQRADNVTDQVETLFVLIERAKKTGVTTVQGLTAMINDMFADDVSGDTNMIVLCSAHRSKGLEWNRVFLLGRSEIMPSRFARQPWQKEQEDNLIYVAVTRAKQELIEVNGIETEADMRRKAA